jgi:hypothetical protein
MRHLKKIIDASNQQELTNINRNLVSELNQIGNYQQVIDSVNVRNRADMNFTQQMNFTQLHQQSST